MKLLIKRIPDVAESILGEGYHLVEENEGRIIMEGIDGERVVFGLKGSAVERITFRTIASGIPMEKEIDFINFSDFSDFNIMYINSLFHPLKEQTIRNCFATRKEVYSVRDITNKSLISPDGEKSFKHITQRRGSLKEGGINGWRSDSLRIFEQESLSSGYGIEILNCQKRTVRIDGLIDTIHQMKTLSKRFHKEGDIDALAELCELYDSINLQYYRNISQMDEGRKLIYSHEN